MRLVVKNIPLKYTENKLREIFEEYGVITDLFLCKKNEKISKGVCFIGYSDENGAKNAIRHRHRSFLTNKRISVEIIKNSRLEELKNEFRKITNRDQTTKVNDNIEVRSKSIYITNLPRIALESDLYTHFNDCNIESIKFPMEHDDKFDFKHVLIQMADFDSAKRAYLNKEHFLGCRLKISFYQEPMKQKKYYNQLFFNFDSIVEGICMEENITRSELLDLKDKHLGIRISLVETHLVEQTKKFLEQNDIFLDNLTGRLDKKALIIRNSNLLSLDFKNCDIKIAPSKTLALIRFKSKSEAKIVYDELQYKRVKDKAIYVDYLPISFSEKRTLKTTNKLIVKNIPFQADKNELKKLFSTKIKIKDLRLPKKANGIHKGYCFLTLNTPEDAQSIIKYFGCSTHLYGRRLVIEPAEN